MNFNTSVDLQKLPVDFHIMGSPVGNGTWSAQGRYINDDGVSLNIDKNYNSYSIYAQYDVTKINITVRIEVESKATNKFDS